MAFGTPAGTPSPAPTAPAVDVAGAWQVRVSPGAVTVGATRVRIAAPVTLVVTPAETVVVKDERYSALPPFNENAAPWAKGAKLRGLAMFETTAADMLVPDSVVLKSAPGDAAPPLRQGTDYAVEPRWATVGRLAGGGLGPEQPVWADYQFGRGRIDSIVVDRKGQVTLLQGVPHNATPLPPSPAPGTAVIANVWVPGRLTSVTGDNLYPILEPRFPVPARKGALPPAARLLPRTWARLRDGRPLHILAWGDSVTAGGEVSDPARRYQDRFVALLGKRFPRASIRLTTVAWPGRNSDHFIREPPGSAYHFEEKVLQARPDLIVMEFVNDAYLTPEQVEERYSALLARFQGIGAEWVILTPHFVRPDWMGAPSVRVEQDPRPYVAGLRRFAAAHDVALADASLRWGHLLKEGVPYVTLLSNSINHPDDRGHELFARSLMELFGGR